MTLRSPQQMAQAAPALNAEMLLLFMALTLWSSWNRTLNHVSCLTMPELDGFGTLDEIQARGIDIKVVVVSGDIQPKAKERVMASGAKALFKSR